MPLNITFGRPLAEKGSGLEIESHGLRIERDARCVRAFVRGARGLAQARALSGGALGEVGGTKVSAGTGDRLLYNPNISA